MKIYIHWLNNQGIKLSIGASRTSPISSILCEANRFEHDKKHNMHIHKFAFKILDDFNDNGMLLYENPFLYFMFIFEELIFTHLYNTRKVNN